MGKVMTSRHATVPSTYMEKIGAVIFYWATFEHDLVDIIGTALGIGKKERRILLAKMDPKAKLAMLKVIGSKYVKRPDTRENINLLATIGNQYYDIRNKFAHGAWVYPTDQPQEYQLLVIDSGETAYLPNRMLVELPVFQSVVDSFSQVVIFARQVLGQMQAEFSAQPEDSEGGFPGDAEGSSSLEIPENVPDPKK